MITFPKRFGEKVAFVTETNGYRETAGAPERRARGRLRALGDSIIFLVVLFFSAAAIVAVACAAPFALAFSALADFFAPSRRNGWRPAHGA